MEKSEKVRILSRILGPVQNRSGDDELLFFCPKHPHHKPKLGVNVGMDRFHCWVCDWGTGSKNLLPILRLGATADEIERYEGSARDLSVERKHDDVVLPEQFLSLADGTRDPHGRAAMSYLKERGLCQGDIILWKIGYCPSGEYRNRVVIPSFDVEGSLNFFVGRAIYPQMLKYKHGNFCKDIIWNECMVDWSRPVVLVEGPFDAFKAAENVVCLNGSSISTGSRLVKKIVESKTDVLLALDSDARRKQLRMARALSAYGIDVRIVPLGDRKDVGEMTKEEFKEKRALAERFDMLRSLVSL